VQEQAHFWGCIIGAGAGTFLGVRRVFAQNSPNCPKNPKEVISKKINAFLFMFGVFFETKEHFKRHFAQISPKLAQVSANLPEKN